jgi:hypothetical protein
MPRVPSLDNFQSSISNPGAPAYQVSGSPTPNDVAVKPGEGLMRAGNAIERIAVDALQEANQLRVDEALTKLNRTAFTLAYDKDTGYTTQKGDKVLPTSRQSGKPLAVEYSESLQKSVKEIDATLSNDNQKQLFARNAARVAIQFESGLMSHEATQYKVWSASVQAGKASMAVNQISADPLNRDNVQTGIGDVISATRKLAEMEGLAPKDTEMKILEATSNAHSSAILGLMRSEDTTGAQTYFRTYKEQMTASVRESLAEKLGVASAANVAVSDAAKIWAEMGPKGFNKATDIDAMIQRADKMYPDDRLKRDALRAEIKARFSTFNASETEFNASNTNAVWSSFGKGKSLGQVMQMPEWLNLPGHIQAQIRSAKISEGYTNEARMNAQEVREQSELQRKGFNAYMIYSDPDTLNAMSPNEVMALAPVIGNQLAGNLLQRKQAMTAKPEKLIEAKMDADEFKSAAAMMGLDPYNTKGARGTDLANRNAALGEVKVRVERLIDEEQSKAKRQLSREEKTELMRREMAKKVLVDSDSWFRPNEEMAVIQLTPSEAARVIVPKSDRSKIIEALSIMYKRNPIPQYEPTEENVRREYLRAKSSAADLINGQ